MRRNLGAVISYGLSVVATAVITLLSVPIVISHSGADAWAAIALGQAIGTGFGVLVGFGWGTTGPTMVAMASSEARLRIFTESFRARAVLLIPAIVTAASLSFFVSGHFKFAATITAIAFTLSGLLSGWYFTGSARPYSYLLFETLPRVLGTAGGSIAILLGASLVSFPMAQGIGILFSVGISGFAILGWRLSRRHGPWVPVLHSLKGQSHGVVIAAISAAYISVPITVVALVAPAALPAFALGDKILRFSTTAFSPVVQFLQGWVPGSDGAGVRRRIRLSFFVMLIATSLAGLTFAAFLPWFAALLSHGKVLLTSPIAIAFALVLVFLIMAQATGLVGLLALGRGQKLAIFTSIGLAVAIPAIFIGTSLFGATGAAFALALSELVAIAPQVVLLAHALHADPVRAGSDSLN